MHNRNVTFCKCSTIKATYTEKNKLLKFNTGYFFVIADFKYSWMQEVPFRVHFKNGNRFVF